MESGLKGILFDENLPSRVNLGSALPIFHCASVGQSLSDTSIWEHSRSHGLVIITKDADFSSRIMLSEPPPWVVHLRFGNMRAKDLRFHLERSWSAIAELLPEHKLINVYLDRIEAIR